MTPSKNESSEPMSRRLSKKAHRAEQSQNPLKLLLRALLLWFWGRLFRVKGIESEMRVGGEVFSAFRKVVLRPEDGRPVQKRVIFQVRFRFKNLSQTANRLLSLMPIPLIAAQPGFHSKTWFLGEETGEFIGFYEFDTEENAEAYWNSLPLRMMRKRAASGSLTYQIFAKDEQHFAVIGEGK